MSVKHLTLMTNNYYFGKGAIESLDTILLPKYKSVMLLADKSISVALGIGNKVKHIVESKGIKFFEYNDIPPNPTVDAVDLAAKIAKAANVDIIIAAGGGSTIDSSKVIATMLTNHHIETSWDLITQKSKMTETPTDIVSISTLAGSGSENNHGSVLTNVKTHQKWSCKTRAPIAAIEDPEYTFSVPPYQTASGLFDSFSHFMETYFLRVKGGKDFEWTNNYLIANMKTILKYAPIVMKDPKNYEARANLFFSASMSLNNLTSWQMEESDWMVHDLEHSITGIWNTTHGATLALVTPTHLRLMMDKGTYRARMSRLAKELWGKSTAEDCLKEIEHLIDVLGLPKKYTDFKNIKTVTKDQIDLMVYNLRRTDIEHAREVFEEIPI